MEEPSTSWLDIHYSREVTWTAICIVIGYAFMRGKRLEDLHCDWIFISLREETWRALCVMIGYSYIRGRKSYTVIFYYWKVIIHNYLFFYGKVFCLKVKKIYWYGHGNTTMCNCYLLCWTVYHEWVEKFLAGCFCNIANSNFCVVVILF